MPKEREELKPEKPEEKPPEKPPKVEKPPELKKPKGKRVRVAKAKFYKLEGGGVKRVGRTCPRCGPGIFMADHANRWACGKCGYTDFKK